MERKICEIFDLDGEWYQCVEGDSCADCCFYENICNAGYIYKTIGSCKYYRTDKCTVIFKKLEKVGEPYEYFVQGRGIIMVQEYILHDPKFVWDAKQSLYIFDCQNGRVAIQIKQNKENMEKYRMHDAKEDISEFDKVVDECLFGKEELKLKPFDIEAAKQGKPVCTRDGRKARIICFDGKFLDSPMWKIVALVENGTEETNEHNEQIIRYDGSGKSYTCENKDDLMMLSEKKEGWVNVYKEEKTDGEYYTEKVIYKTRKDAFDNACTKYYVATVKIEWKV